MAFSKYVRSGGSAYSRHVGKSTFLLVISILLTILVLSERETAKARAAELAAAKEKAKSSKKAKKTPKYVSSGESDDESVDIQVSF